MEIPPSRLSHNTDHGAAATAIFRGVVNGNGFHFSHGFHARGFIKQPGQGSTSPPGCPSSEILLEFIRCPEKFGVQLP